MDFQPKNDSETKAAFCTERIAIPIMPKLSSKILRVDIGTQKSIEFDGCGGYRCVQKLDIPLNNKTRPLPKIKSAVMPKTISKGVVAILEFRR